MKHNNSITLGDIISVLISYLEASSQQRLIISPQGKKSSTCKNGASVDLIIFMVTLNY